MRDISVSIEVFRMIWALSNGGEDSEDRILRRLLAEYWAICGADDMPEPSAAVMLRSLPPEATPDFWDGVRAKLGERRRRSLR